jgi:hypothetical protein
MDIKWSINLINELNEIVSYLKKNKIGETLENLGNYFISKYLKYLQIENYTMEFLEEIDPTQISDGEFKLAFICELMNSKSDKNKVISLTEKKKKEKIKRPKGFKNVYSSFSEMLKFCIGNNFKLNQKKIDYKSFYLLNMLKEIICHEKKIENIEVLSLPYFLTLEIMSICESDINILYKNYSLILKTEELDISILNKKQIREILNILNTKKTIYVRILLVLTFEIMREKNISEIWWIYNSLSFNNREDFISVMTSPLVEILLFIVSYRISKKINY